MGKPFFRSLRRLGVLACGLLFFVGTASAINLVWDPPPAATPPGKVVTGYKLYYGIKDFTIAGSTTDGLLSVLTGLSTNAVVSDLLPGITYFFAVVSVDAEGDESGFSNVISYTPPLEVVSPPPITDTGVTNTTGITPPDNVSSDQIELSLVGMLPKLWLYSTNGQALVAIQGTLGAIFTVQSSTNPADADSWITVTNIQLSTVAPTANPNPATTLEKAFIPALETIQDSSSVDGLFRFYRIYLPLGYVAAAAQALWQREFAPRLIAVRCPGLRDHIVCYVPEEGAYIDYDEPTSIVRLEPSGPTLREIANNIADLLSLDWTSASEFTVSPDGLKSIFATVFQTDDPLTDPPLGVPGVSGLDIILDF